MNASIISLLNKKVDEYNQPFFIANDPICIPHSFQKKQDIEIAGLFAAVFAWGNRTTIINKSKELMQLMHNEPYDFCINHTDNDLKKLLQFKHRTFNATDLLYFIAFLQSHYKKYDSLESAFTINFNKKDTTIENALIGFFNYFFSLEDAPDRTRKHIASPEKNSSCKRLCMYLRWMCRQDNKGVDFGIWKQIKPRQLIMPIDVHVARVANKIGLTKNLKADWKTACELTEKLRTLDDRDPVKYDFALFNLGVMEKY
jgi:uncharacterized protein (TIGR02757 family)